MIRVNLLPHKRAAAKEETSQAWIAVLMGVLFLQAIGLFFFHQTKTNELARQRQTNTEIQQQIDEIKKTVANHAKVKADLGVFRQREEAISKLQAGRTGPAAVLLELAAVLTQGRMPQVDLDKLAQLRKDNPAAVPNPAWDTRRMWLLSYKEADRVVTIEGLARDGEDVSELARRLALSDYFEGLKVLPGAKIKAEKGVEMVRFQLQARAKYLWHRPRNPVRPSAASPSPRNSVSGSDSSSSSESPTSCWATARWRARSPPRSSRRRRCVASSPTPTRASLCT